MNSPSFFSKSKYLVFIFSMLLIWSCAIPIPVPEQNFNTSLKGAEYDAFDLAAESISTYQKEKVEKNKAFLKSIKKSVEEKTKYTEWFERAKSADSIGTELSNSVDGIWDQIVFSSGGKDAKGHPLGADQKIAAENILLKQEKGAELQNQISQVKIQLLDLIQTEDKGRIENGFPDFLKNENWVLEKTENLEIGILQLSFAHLSFGIEKAKEEMLFYFWDKINSPPLVYDRFEIVASTQKSMIRKGDRYEADIYLAPVLNPFGDENTSVVINGQKFTVEDGVVKYRVTTNSLGDKKYSVQYNVQNPLTGETTSYQKEFEYTVGEYSINVSAIKMNVLYVGVDNPISVSAPGVNSHDLKVSISGGGKGNLRKINGNQYRVKVSRATKLGDECVIQVSANGLTQKSYFRVKRVPDPVAKIGKKTGGVINVAEFKAQLGVVANLENFDFDARCKVAGFAMTRFPKEMDKVEMLNKGARYSAESKKIIDEATPGDIYIFDQVKARCPGDIAGRQINSMVFKIK